MVRSFVGRRYEPVIRFRASIDRATPFEAGDLLIGVGIVLARSVTVADIKR